MCNFSKATSENIKIVSYEEDERLKEKNFGDWEMRKWDIFRRTTQSWMEDFVTIPVSNGESFSVYIKE
ncbi:histidine phosphatase family protein [Flavobacterium procerum]|uniref:histidine phosphatase family protein n=1 Tax=Flavobacterium procerum TaxID=1455569 RepID=UPI0035E733F1